MFKWREERKQTREKENKRGDNFEISIC